MQWPTPADYQEAIQSPQLCFADADLKSGSVGLNSLGLPRVASGNFASVYRIKSSSAWAVRCFLRPVPDGERRYDAIAKHLQISTGGCLLPFHFLANGIRVHGRLFPIVKMQWSDCEPLSLWVQRSLNNSQALLNVADALRSEVANLQRQQISHCDLQHGNILVSKTGHVELVDYDGMFVPAFAGERSPELGHVNFQHPARKPDDYDQYVDNFAALVILASLKALSEQPSLWHKYNTGENLIFSADDFRAPAQARVFRELAANGSAEVRDLSGRLAGLCGGWPLPQVAFENILTQTPPVRPLRSVSQVATTAAGAGTGPVPSWLVQNAPPQQRPPATPWTGPQRSQRRQTGTSVSGKLWKGAVIAVLAIALGWIVFRVNSHTLPAVGFYGDRSSLSRGEPVTLHWSVKDAQQIRIEPGIGVVPPTGYRTISPQTTTQYTLTAEGSGGTISNQFTVRVEAPLKKKRSVDVPAFVPAPSIVHFQASRLSVPTGGSTSLRWSVAGSTAVRIEPGLGLVPADGERTILPTQTTQYTLTAEGPGGNAEDRITVQVEGAPAAPPLDPIQKVFVAVSRLVVPISGGGTCALTPGDVLSRTDRITGNAVDVTILSSKLGDCPPGATVSVEVIALGAMHSQFTEQVSSKLPAPTIVAFEAVPTPVEQCAVAILRWTVQGATSATILPGIGSVSATTGYKAVRPVQTARYTLKADSPGGTVSRDVTLSVSNATRSSCGQ